MGVRLTIEELVLNGFDRATGDRIARSFERELGRLLREQPLSAPGADQRIDAVRGVSVHARTARRLGIELAQAVHASLAGSDPGPGERP